MTCLRLDDWRLTLIAVKTPEEEKYLLNTFQGVAQRRDQGALLRAFCQKLPRDTSDQGDSLGRNTHEFSILRLLERVLIGLKGDFDQNIYILTVLTIQACINLLIL